MTAPSNANTSGLAPADALRLVPMETLRRCAAVLADPKAEHSHDVSYLIEEVEAIAAALADALRLVPVEPTPEMMNAAWVVFRNSSWHDLTPTDIDRSVGTGAFREAWSTMIAAAPASPLPGGLPPISLDGPHEIDFHRQWLARQLLDSKLDDEEAYSIVRHDPAIRLPAAPTGEPK